MDIGRNVQDAERAGRHGYSNTRTGPDKKGPRKSLQQVSRRFLQTFSTSSKGGEGGNAQDTLEGKDAWLGDVLKKLTNLKISLGLDPNCTPEKEFVRLAINGYKNIKIGTELDRILLEKDDATPE